MEPVPSLVPPGTPSLHVLQVVGNGIVGGMETFVRRLVERLPQPRFRISALLPYECELADELRALQLPVHITPMPEEPAWASIQGSLALIRSLGVDVVHAHLPPAHALAGIAGHLSGTPVLASIHGRQLTMLDLEVHRATGTHLHVVCEQSHRHALGLGIDPGRIECIANGVDTELFRPAEAQEHAAARAGPGTLRGELRLAADVPLVGFVGRLSPEKGPELFVRMALLVHCALPQLHFVMLGDGPLRSAVGAAIERFGLQGHVHRVGERAGMPALYRELDLLVSTSFSVAMPLAQMEAMASGLAVVATGVGGVPELIEHRRSGWLVSPGDAEGLAGAVTQVMQTAGLREAMAQRARQRAVQRLGIENSARRIAQLLERLHAEAGKRNGVGAVARDGVSPVPRSSAAASNTAGQAASSRRSGTRVA